MKSLEVKKYKNFEHLTLNDLANINLIVGKNNVGKSALLEAVSIFASNGDLEQIKAVLASRGEGVGSSSSVEKLAEKEMERFLSLYHQWNVPDFLNHPIEISANEKLSGRKTKFSMRLAGYIKSLETDSQGFERPYKLLEDNNEAMFENPDIHIGLLLSYDERKTFYMFNGERKRNPAEGLNAFEYVRTNQIMGDKNPKLYDKIALTPNEKYIIKALQIIEPQIENINFLKDDKAPGQSDERVPFVVLKNESKRYRLSAMGDGINRILTIILAMLNCENGVLLIDEFENGLHYSVQYQLWKVINDLSTKLNVQVFATTHSMDTLRSLSELINDYPIEEMQDKVACYYLQRTQTNEIKGYRYSADNFEFLINKGEDIR
ncbi:ATP-binding protein [Bacteroides graminisolvens]|uniref:AAA family ATPase n=1 Tax=Bacteroides graminisolvens TaxID=477666 RepID=UPI0029C8300E|nr:ATP-binding protein [Bacteroides graminisolvens]